MDWNKPWSEEKTKGKEGRKKWNFVFLESLKMAVILPLVILFIEVFILKTWSNIGEHPVALVPDFLFLFSIIFLIFVIYHLLLWKRM